MKSGIMRALAVLSILLPSAVLGCNALTFSEPWVREPPPVASTAAAYVEIENPSTRPVTIESVRSDCCDSVMMHETEVVDGVNRMRHLHAIEIAPGESFRLQPLGAHLMLFAPNQPLRAGESIGITFVCREGEPATVDFVSRRR